MLIWFLSTILCIVEGKSLALGCHDKVLVIVLGNWIKTSPLRDTGLCVGKVLYLVKEKDSKQKKNAKCHLAENTYTQDKIPIVAVSLMPCRSSLIHFACIGVAPARLFTPQANSRGGATPMQEIGRASCRERV